MGGRSRVGDVVFGRFRIEGPLGQGTAGFSYRALDLETERATVVKEFPAEQHAQLDRYQGETALLATLGPSCVDPGGIERLVRPLLSGSEHGQPYSVRPYVEGQSLRERLRAGPLREDEIRTLLGDTARVLRAAHRENLVLRNLKPENIFLEAGARARVVGLGTGCFLIRSRRESLGVELGGLRYVSPEQVLDARRVDRTTDMFVLGLLLYECLQGEPRIPGSEVVEVLEYLANPRPPSLPQGNSELAELSLRLTTFNPAERPTQIEPVLETLAPWVLEPELVGRCEGCDEGLTHGTAHCSSCGRAARGPCPHCGRSLALGAGFCVRCGQSTGEIRRARLVGLTGGFAGEAVELPTQDEIRMGRSTECDISFDGRDSYVSRHQARLVRKRGRFWLQGGDWQTGRPTTNGTLLNGRNTDGLGPQLLRHGDRLRMGDSFFRYEEAA